VIRDVQPSSSFLELIHHFFGLKLKILEYFDVDPGSGMEKSRIRDPGSRKTSRIRNTANNEGEIF
jgi:hypothetical protein